MYDLEIEEKLHKEISKLSRKDPALHRALEKKVLEIRENPSRFKPLRAPLQNKYRIHIGSFVLVYTIDEQRKVVRLLVFDHHDVAYRK